MSARQLARLRALIEEKKRIAEEAAREEEYDEEEDEYEEEYEDSNKVSFSAFIDSEEEEETEEETEEEEEQSSDSSEEETPAKVEEQGPSKEELEDAYIEELYAASQAEQIAEMEESYLKIAQDDGSIHLGSILQINKKRLNDLEESNSRFGNDENAMGRGQRQRQRAMRRAGAATNSMTASSIFITPTAANVRPPSVLGGGFSFDAVETPFHFDQGSLSPLDTTAVFYSIHASPEYSRLVEEYRSYKTAYLTDDIGDMAIRFYQKHPYLLHVAFDLCQIMLMYKDAEHVFEILRQCLFIIEKALGPRCDLTSGNVRFLYSEEDNRVIYKALRLYIHMCLRKSCFETALNSAMMLYSFCPQCDPTGTLPLIPFLALSAKRFTTLTRIAEAGLAIGPLPLLFLPNWGFDYGLALYRLGEKQKAKDQIRECLKRWPTMINGIKEHSKASLTIPTNIAESKAIHLGSINEDAALLLHIFCQREVQLWCNSEIWTLVIGCYQDMLKETSEEELLEYQSEMRDMYEALRSFFDHIEEISDIGDNLFTVDPTDYTDSLPEVDMNEILGDLRQRQLEEQMANQLEGMRVPNNIPVDHNLLQLFFEALNPNMNAAELNDDDIAAMQEQIDEILMAGGGANIVENEDDEGEWQQDWDSDNDQ